MALRTYIASVLTSQAQTEGVSEDFCFLRHLNEASKGNETSLAIIESVRTAANSGGDTNAVTELDQMISSSEVLTSPLLRIRYVDFNNGDDTTGNGSASKPYKTIEVAQNSFSDQSASIPYTLFLAPGSYSESPTYKPKQYVNLVGSGRDATIIFHSDNSSILMTYDGDNFTQQFQDLRFAQSLIITRNYVGPVAITSTISVNVNFYNVRITGTTTINGSGNNGVGPFNFDTFIFTNCQLATLNSNAVNCRLNSTIATNCTYTAIGVDMVTTSGLISQINNSNVQFVTASGSILIQARGSTTTRYTLDDSLGIINSDSISFPQGGGGQFYNATKELTQFTFSQSGSFYDVSGAGLAAQLFNSPSTGHYFWFKVTNGTNTQTDPVLTGTGHQVDILLTDTATIIAGKFSAAVTLITSAFTSTNFSPLQVNVTNVTAGTATDATVTGSAATVSVLRQGSATVATMTQIQSGTFASKIRNGTRTVTASPNTLNIDTDKFIKTNLTIAGPVSLTMPAMTTTGYPEGKEITIFDAKGDASINNITITAGTNPLTSVQDTFSPGGATSYVISTDNGCVTFIWSGAVWYLKNKNF